MDLTMVIMGPLLRLGFLALLLNPLPSHDPARTHDVRIMPMEDDRGLPTGRQVVLVDGHPFFPIGVSYHFTAHRTTWDDDLQAMHDLGLNTVRIDLAWRDVQPLFPGAFRFGELDEFLDRAAAHGLYVVPVFSHTTEDFNTPIWFWARFHDWRVVDQAGRVPLADLPSVNHRAYRSMLRRYVEETVRHIRSRPAVLAYQLLNEPRYDSKRLYDYNPLAVEAFRGWLQRKYGFVDRMNKLWGTTYPSFQEADPLREDPSADRDPRLSAQWSDWRQFSYDNLASFTSELARSIKAVDQGHPVIVSEMAWWWWGEQPYTAVSPLHIYRDADIVGYDLYPDSLEDASYLLLTSDMLLRYWSRPVWVMEVNRKDGNPSAEEIRKFVSSALDGGASGIFYFQWRNDASDGGGYGVLDEKGRRRPQYGGLASAVRWLKTRAHVIAEPLSQPDLYLVWPSQAVGEVSGAQSPAWNLYRTARLIAEGGLRIGLVAEELIHAIDPGKLLTLRNGQLHVGKDQVAPDHSPTRGILSP